LRMFAGRDDTDFAFFYEATHRTWCVDIEMYLAFARRMEGEILELACGDGRILAALAGAGFRITGIDNSPAMLDMARKRLARAPGDLAGAVRLVEADIAAFDLDRAFPLAICAFNSFCLLVADEDRRAFLARLKQHLTHEGVAVIDMFNPRGEFLDSLPEASFNTPHLDQTVKLGEGRILRDSTSNRYDRTNDILWVRKTYELRQGASCRTRQFEVPARVIRRNEAEEAFAAAGFLVEDVYGWYDFSDYSSAGKQMVFVLKRAEGE